MVGARKGSKSKHGKRSSKSRSKSRSKRRSSKSRKGRKSRKRHSKRRRRGKSRSKSRSRNRSKRSRSRRSKRSRKSKKRKRSKRRRSSKSRSRKGMSAKKEQIMKENRKLLIKSQSLTAPAKDKDKNTLKAEESNKDSTLVNFDTKITAYSPMKKDKKTKLSDDGAILKAAPPVLESNVSTSSITPNRLQFQPLRSPDYREYKKKKEDDSPSTAIDIDSSIRMSHPKSKTMFAVKEPAIKPSKRKRETKQKEEKKIKQREEELPFEPAAQRVSDLVPIEEGVDRNYPAQRIVISNFVRNGCHVKRWLYEDSYPVDGPRPAICDVMAFQQRNPYSKCCCGRKKVCDGFCGKDLFSKEKQFGSDSAENERIRGELQRLDVILKNLDD